MAKNVILTKVVKKYGNTEVVHGIDLHIKKNEFIVLVGPSGCAKSTTLRMIAGLEEITAGTIKFDDKIVNDLAPRDRNISMVFQNYALYPHMSVSENIGFGLKIAKITPEEIKTRVKKAADMLGLSELLDRRPAELSGGQRQRVAMGRAIVREPDVFLFDEPLSNLDAKLRGQMRVEIKKLHQKLNKTIIYVTHDQVEAMTLADRIVIMRDGNIEQVGTPLEVFNKPKNTFVASFIGSPPMNMIDAIVQINSQNQGSLSLDDNISIPLPQNTINKVADKQNVIVGFRPDDISPIGHAMQNTEDLIHIELIVQIAEPLGNETILYSTIGAQEVQAKMHNPRAIKPQEKITFTIPLSRIYLFDGATGDNLIK